jgi:hypothetical protein
MLSCLQNLCFVKYFDSGGGCSPAGPFSVRARNCVLSIAVGSVGPGETVLMDRWRKLHNEELDDMYWIKWAGYVA